MLPGLFPDTLPGYAVAEPERPMTLNDARKARLALAAMFAANGALMGAWAPQIPLLLTRHEIGKGVLGLMILALGFGAVTAMLFTGRLIAREGFHVLTAKDGVDAVEQLQEAIPDVMLVDIEMPRMDGFDLTRAVRGDPRLRHIPIIMITSRTAERHRAYAKEIGVNVYLGKPFQEEELLGHIAGFVGKAATAPA